MFYDHGVVPPWFVKLFAARRAYIYMLEVFAQIIAFAAFAQLMPPTVVAFIDNTAGQAALTKGYGKDPAINGMISAFWNLAARRGWFVEFERVPSKANVADAASKKLLQEPTSSAPQEDKPLLTFLERHCALCSHAVVNQQDWRRHMKKSHDLEWISAQADITSTLEKDRAFKALQVL